jgi:hypothetical protein
MRKRSTHVLLVGICYIGLCIATNFIGKAVLKQQLLKGSLAQWKDSLPAQEAASERSPGQPETMAFKSGPKIRVELSLCFIPLIFGAECSRVIGGLNGYGTVGIYLLTPWRVYVLSETQTWVS